MLGPVLKPDIQYTRLYYLLAEKLYKGEIDLERIRNFIKELGIKEVFTKPEKGIHTIYVETIFGDRKPFEYYSSGVRESLLLALSLATKDPVRSFNVFIEEPEAHLHPKALRELTRLIAKRIGISNIVFITTHSDHLIYSLNNHMMLSKYSEEEPGKARLWT